MGGPEDVDGGGGVLASGRCEEEVTRLERGATAAAVAASYLSCCFTEWVCYNTNEKIIWEKAIMAHIMERADEMVKVVVVDAEFAANVVF